MAQPDLSCLLSSLPFFLLTQFLLFTRALGVNTLPWLARLPFKASMGGKQEGSMFRYSLHVQNVCMLIGWQSSFCKNNVLCCPFTPQQWFMWVHLVSVADAARLSLAVVCSSPAFTGAEAQQHYASATRMARVLAMLAPTPSQQTTGELVGREVLLFFGACPRGGAPLWLPVCHAPVQLMRLGPPYWRLCAFCR